MTAVLDIPVKKPKRPITPEIAREYQRRGVITRRSRILDGIVNDAMDVSKPANCQEIGLLVRSNMAQSILIQSAILRQQKPREFKHLLGKGRKPGILDVCERLANAAKTVFQWGGDESQAMISIGSFVQITQAPQSAPSLSPEKPVIDIPEQIPATAEGIKPMSE